MKNVFIFKICATYKIFAHLRVRRLRFSRTDEKEKWGKNRTDEEVKRYFYGWVSAFQKNPGVGPMGGLYYSLLLNITNSISHHVAPLLHSLLTFF